VRDALELADLARRAAHADEAEALVMRERSGLARFAGSRVHQPTLIENESVQLRVVRDGCVGSASTNRTEPDDLAQLARRAEQAADSAPPDPGFPGLSPPAEAPPVAGFDDETAALSAAEQSELAWTAIAAARGIGLYGYFTSGVSGMAIASSTGQAVYQAMTDATIVALAADGEASGWAEATAWRAAALDAVATAGEAVAKASRTRGAGELEPGDYRAVLEPYAFAELLATFAAGSVNGLALVEGRSYLAGRLGEQVFHPSLTLLDDGRDASGLPKAFDFEGTPKEAVTIVEDGVALDVVWDRRSAALAGGGRRSTGHALPAPAQGWGPYAANLIVRPGSASLDELAERVGDGIHVTRLHYLSVVDEREGIITGMTRDGTFRIENGRVTRPLVNLRFTTSVPELLRGLLGLTATHHLVNTADFYDERYPTAALVPGVATERFTVSGNGSGPGL
jgi:predicted Zn-dependent protease